MTAAPAAVPSPSVAPSPGGGLVGDLLTRLLPLYEQHPRVVLGVVAGVVLLAAVIGIARMPVFYRATRQFWYQFRNAFTADAGMRDILYWVFAGGVVAFPLALLRGYGKPGDPRFHWGEFWFVLGIFMVSNLVRVLFQSLTEGNRLLRPVHGGRWRMDRKIQTAAILKKINLASAGRADPLAAKELRELLSDILDVIGLHVRDHRGNHSKNVQVFATLLLVDGDELVVVARDRNLAHKDRKRPVPVRYPKALLAAGRAVESRSAVSVGDYHIEYPEFPKDKPYRSILVIPLTSSKDDNVIFGVVSIDSSRPYFFQSFTPGAAENELENTLAPYLHTLVLVLETLAGRQPAEMLRVVQSAAGSQ
jgi:hypothetical protein